MTIIAAIPGSLTPSFPARVDPAPHCSDSFLYVSEAFLS
jgi:hypothetical protein